MRTHIFFYFVTISNFDRTFYVSEKNAFAKSFTAFQILTGYLSTGCKYKIKHHYKTS